MSQRDEAADIGPGTHTRVMLVEDDADLAERFMEAFEKAGMPAIWASNGTTALAMRAHHLPDVVVLDLGLPDIGGFAMVSRLVHPGGCGIVMMADTAEEVDCVVGLELGADDYMPKSAPLRELVARVRAVHRRTAGRAAAAGREAADVLDFGPVRINAKHRAVTRIEDGVRIVLTSAEFGALVELARADGRTVTRDRLSMAALGRPWRAEDRSVDQIVFNLRHKLPPDSDGQLLIQSIRGTGYWMRSPDVRAASVPAARPAPCAGPRAPAAGRP